MAVGEISVSITEDITTVDLTQSVTTVNITPSVTEVDVKGISIASASASGIAYPGQSNTLGTGSNVDLALDHINTNGFNKNADNTIAASKSITFPSQSPVYNVLNLNNNNITGVNHVTFSDAGPNEGLIWQNVRIYESPDDLTTNVPSGAGNFQVVHKQSDNSYARRFTVRDTGVDVVGTITFDGGTTSANLDFATNARARFGDGQQLQIYSDGTTSYIDENGSGNLLIRGNNLHLQKYTGANYLTAVADGATTLFHNGNTKIATTSAGIDVTGTVTFDGGTTSADLNFADNAKARFGNSNDLQIYHDGSSSIIHDNGTGHLRLHCNDLRIRNSGNTEALITADQDGAVELYHDGSKKIETTSGGVDVTGDLAVTGNLTVGGSTTTINSTELTVDDKNITLADGAGNASAADGGGITLAGASATLTYASGTDSWNFNKGLNTTGNSSVTGTLNATSTVTAPTFSGDLSGTINTATTATTQTAGNNTTKVATTAFVTSAVSGKVNTTDIVNNLTSTDTNKPLSAAQGKALKDDALQLGTIAGTALAGNTTIPSTVVGLSDVPTPSATGQLLVWNNDDTDFDATNNITLNELDISSDITFTAGATDFIIKKDNDKLTIFSGSTSNRIMTLDSNGNLEVKGDITAFSDFS